MKSRTIELVAPSSFLIRKIPQRWSGLWRVCAPKIIVSKTSTRHRFERFGGTDAGSESPRLASPRLADPSRRLPDIVLAVRGGYGASRLLHGLDYRGLQQLADQPIALVGHSDFTAIQCALFAQAGIKSFGGPMFVADFGAEELSSFTMHHFWQVSSHPTLSIASHVPQRRPVAASGMLWGGNLAILASLVGTPYLAAGRRRDSLHRGCE